MSLCREFHVLPSVLLEEDVQLLRLMRIEDMGRRETADE